MFKMLEYCILSSSKYYAGQRMPADLLFCVTGISYDVPVYYIQIQAYIRGGHTLSLSYLAAAYEWNLRQDVC